MNIKDHAKLSKQIAAHLQSLGAAAADGQDVWASAWILATPLGDLNIKLERHCPREKLYSIFCRFDKPALGASRFPHEANPYNGKWNLHFGHGCTVASICAVFFSEIARTCDAKAIALSVAQWTPKGRLP